MKKVDVTIVGAGPAGLVTACTLSILNENLKVAVVDFRSKSTRHYALKFDPDSIESLIATVDKASSRKEEFCKLIKSWSSQAIKVSTIESSLAKVAQNLQIQVVRDENFKVTEESLKSLKQDTEIGSWLASSQVIVGADGRHSVVRKTVMGNDTTLHDHEYLGYFLELKFEVPKETEERSYLEASREASVMGFVGLQIMGEEDTSLSKPVTMHFFINQEIYEAFHDATNETPWTFDRLKEEGKLNPILKRTYYALKYHLERYRPQNLTMKRLPVEIYLSQKGASLFQSKIIALAGDARSGMVFARGVNKAFIEAGMLGTTLDRFFRSSRDISTLPEEFVNYEEATHSLFEEEKAKAKEKAAHLTQINHLVDAIRITDWAAFHPKKRKYIKTLFTSSFMMLGTCMTLHTCLGSLSISCLGCTSLNELLLKIVTPLSLSSILIAGYFLRKYDPSIH